MDKLFIAGDQVPEIDVGLFVELVGNAGIELPEQYGPTAAKLGRVVLLIIIVPVAFKVPQPPTKGIA